MATLNPACATGNHALCQELGGDWAIESCDCQCHRPAMDHATPEATTSDHNAYHMLYRRTAMGGGTEVVYAPSVEEAIAALYERSVKWDDLRIVHQDLCWCQHTRPDPEPTSHPAPAPGPHGPGAWRILAA